MKIVQTDTVEFKGQPRRGSRYDGVFEALRKLRKGQCCLLPIGKGMDPRTAHNRLNSAMSRVDLQPPRGCKWEKRTTTDNEIAISAVKA